MLILGRVLLLLGVFLIVQIIFAEFMIRYFPQCIHCCSWVKRIGDKLVCPSCGYEESV